MALLNGLCALPLIFLPFLMSLAISASLAFNTHAPPPAPQALVEVKTAKGNPYVALYEDVGKVREGLGAGRGGGRRRQCVEEDGRAAGLPPNLYETYALPTTP